MAFVAINASFFTNWNLYEINVWITNITSPGGRSNLLKQMSSLWIACVSNISHRAQAGVSSFPSITNVFHFKYMMAFFSLDSQSISIYVMETVAVRTAPILYLSSTRNNLDAFHTKSDSLSGSVSNPPASEH